MLLENLNACWEYKRFPSYVQGVNTEGNRGPKLPKTTKILYIAYKHFPQ